MQLCTVRVKTSESPDASVNYLWDGCVTLSCNERNKYKINAGIVFYIAVIVSPGRKSGILWFSGRSAYAYAYTYVDFLTSGLQPLFINQSSGSFAYTFIRPWRQNLVFLGVFRYPRWPLAAIFEKKWKPPIFVPKLVSGDFQQNKFFFFFQCKKMFGSGLENFSGIFFFSPVQICFGLGFFRDFFLGGGGGVLKVVKDELYQCWIRIYFVGLSWV